LKLGGGNNTRSSRTSQPQLNAYNIQGNWLKNILEMHYAVNSKNDGLLLLLQIKIEALLSDSHKLLMNTQDTVARLCQEVIGKIKSNGAYKIDDKAKTFVLNHIIKAVIDSLKIDLNKDASLLKLTDEEKNSIMQNIPIIASDAPQVSISNFVLGTFKSIKHDLEEVFEKNKENIKEEYNSIHHNNTVNDYGALKIIVLKTEKFDELQRRLNVMNNLIESITDIGQNLGNIAYPNEVLMSDV
jgi:hypothetical protein